MVAPGKSYFDLMHALRSLGLEGTRWSAPAFILKLGMVSPLEPQIARDFAAGLDEILVAEEKGPFVETLLKDALYGLADAPRVLGKRDETGAPLLPTALDLDADLIARAVAARLAARHHDRLRGGAPAQARRNRQPLAELPMAQRTPFFCSGCPHSSSLKAPDGTLVGGGIGCHDGPAQPRGAGRDHRHHADGWRGARSGSSRAPFTDDSHLVQNLGDGTFHHSGSLAVRAAVAAGVNITYKLLYNEHVYATGGQAIEGQLSVPDLTRWLELRGVRRIIVTTEDLSRYRGVDLAGIAEVRDRGELLAAQQELAGVEGDRADPRPGVRGRVAAQAQARKGRGAGRARVDQRTGLRGLRRLRPSQAAVGDPGGDGVRTQDPDPPGQLQQGPLVSRGRLPLASSPWSPARRDSTARPSSRPVPEPVPLVSATDFSVRMMGIGGTGVVTVNQVLGMAALIDGRHVSGLDQTGLSQKGEPVISDLRVTRDPLPAASKTR